MSQMYPKSQFRNGDFCKLNFNYGKCQNSKGEYF